MIEKKAAPDSPDAVRSACEKFRQGHLIEGASFFYQASLDYPVWELAQVEATRGYDDPLQILTLTEEQLPEHGIITTQSCDIWRVDQQPWFQVAPVFQADENDEILQAGAEFIVPLSPDIEAGGKTLYADLRLEVPLEKGVLVGREPIESFSNEDGYIQFGDILARRRGRPALHNVFHVLLNVVMREMKNESGEHKRRLREIRSRVYGLRLAIEEGTRIEPAAAKLYVVTRGAPDAPENAIVADWFGEWWDNAMVAAEKYGLRLLPNGWLEAEKLDVTIYDDLVPVKSVELDR